MTRSIFHKSTLSGMNYISIFNSLSIESYIGSSIILPRRDKQSVANSPTVTLTSSMAFSQSIRHKFSSPSSAPLTSSPPTMVSHCNRSLSVFHFCNCHILIFLISNCCSHLTTEAGEVGLGFGPKLPSPSWTAHQLFTNSFQLPFTFLRVRFSSQSILLLIFFVFGKLPL